MLGPVLCIEVGHCQRLGLQVRDQRAGGVQPAGLLDPDREKLLLGGTGADDGEQQQPYVGIGVPAGHRDTAQGRRQRPPGHGYAGGRPPQPRPEGQGRELAAGQSIVPPDDLQ